MLFLIGACCFGIVIGYVTYRTLVRQKEASISDIAAVIAAVGGGAVTSLFDPSTGDAFGLYAIGLLAGMIVFLVLRLVLERPQADKTPGRVVLGESTSGDATSDVFGS